MSIMFRASNVDIIELVFMCCSSGLEVAEVVYTDRNPDNLYQRKGEYYKLGNINQNTLP